MLYVLPGNSDLVTDLRPVDLICPILARCPRIDDKATNVVSDLFRKIHETFDEAAQKMSALAHAFESLRPLEGFGFQSLNLCERLELQSLSLFEELAPNCSIHLMDWERNKHRPEAETFAVIEVPGNSSFAKSVKDNPAVFWLETEAGNIVFRISSDLFTNKRAVVEIIRSPDMTYILRHDEVEYLWSVTRFLSTSKASKDWGSKGEGIVQVG